MVSRIKTEVRVEVVWKCRRDKTGKLERFRDGVSEKLSEGLKASMLMSVSPLNIYPSVHSREKVFLPNKGDKKTDSMAVSQLLSADIPTFFRWLMNKVAMVALRGGYAQTQPHGLPLIKACLTAVSGKCSVGQQQNPTKPRMV